MVGHIDSRMQIGGPGSALWWLQSKAAGGTLHTKQPFDFRGMSQLMIASMMTSINKTLKQLREKLNHT